MLRGIGLVTASLTAEDEFTADTIGATQAATGMLGIRIKSFFNLSISGTWVGTLTLQRSFDAGTTFMDVENFTANQENWDQEIESGVLYRIGFKTGNYTSGTALVRISK